MAKYTLIVEQTSVFNGQVTWIGHPVEIDSDDFLIDETNLNVEACRIGQFMFFYGNLYADLKSQLSRKEEGVKRRYAFIANNHREAGVKPNDAVKEKTMIEETYIQAIEECNITRRDALKAEAWWRTIQHKSEMIRMLGYRQNTELKKGY